MKYTNEEIVKALQVIKGVCGEAKYCSKCPLRYGVDCYVTNSRPEEWEITTEMTPWKAFDY